jgi:hypothetical protein
MRCIGQRDWGVALAQLAVCGGHVRDAIDARGRPVAGVAMRGQARKAVGQREAEQLGVWRRVRLLQKPEQLSRAS